jgi:hypothetical protein
MFDKINDWCQDNYKEITWFLIGFLLCSGFNEFGRGDYGSAAFDWLVVAINYVMYRRRY